MTNEEVLLNEVGPLDVRLDKPPRVDDARDVGIALRVDTGFPELLGIIPLEVDVAGIFSEEGCRQDVRSVENPGIFVKDEVGFALNRHEIS